MKVLIVAPPLDYSGGVSNFYRMLSPHLPQKEVEFFHICKKKNFIYTLYHRIIDPFLFFFLLMRQKDFQTILLNPSLVQNSFLRDGVLCWIAHKIFGRNVAVFWHGWSVPFERKIIKSNFLKFFFKHFYGNAFLMFSLSKLFSESLIKFGSTAIQVNITTCIEDSLFQKIELKEMNPVPYRYLFLSRLEPGKGVEIVLGAYAKLKKKYGNAVELIIAGDGSMFDQIQNQIKTQKIEDVFMPGYVRGNEKIQLLQKAHCFCFPSTYGEGMPCALLEAMGAGLTILTSAAGGISDFFITPDMGIMTQDVSEEIFEKHMEALYLSSRKNCSPNTFNRQYAQNNFLASNVSKKILTFLQCNPL